MAETTTAAEQLHQAARLLAADDADHAQYTNSVGYSKADGSTGHALAMLPPAEWDAQITRTAWVTLRKYKAQLAGAGFDFDSIPEPPKADGEDRGYVRFRAEPYVAKERSAGVAAESTVDFNGEVFVVTFVKYDGRLVGAVKAIPGRQWNGKSNTLPKDQALSVATFADENGLALTDAAADVIAAAVEAQGATTVEEAVAAYRPTIKVGIDSEGFFVDLPFELNERRVSLKADVGPRFDGQTKVWRLVVSAANAAKLLAWSDTQTDIEVSDDARAVMVEQAETAVKSLEASQAMDADIAVPGLAEGIELMPFQRGGVAYVADHYTGTIIGDEMGLGKTPQGIASVVYLQEVLGVAAFPAAVIVPNVVKINWSREIPKFFPGRTVLIVEGTQRRDIPDGFDFYVIPDSIIGDRWEDVAALFPKAVIVDEIHRIKNGNRQALCPDCGKKVGRSNAVTCPNCFMDVRDRIKFKWSVKRTNGVLQLAKCLPPDTIKIGLSGTLITNRAVEGINPVDFCGKLDEFGGEFGWKMRYCGAYKDRYGWRFDGSSNLEELHEKLRMVCYVRRNKLDVIAELPPRVHAPRYLEVTAKGRARYRSVEADVIAEIGQRAMAKSRTDIETDAEILAGDDTEAIAAVLRKRGLSSADEFSVDGELLKVNWEAQGRASTAEHLVSIGLLKQVATECKMEAVYEWLDEFFEDDPDRKIVVFAENINVVEGIVAHYGDKAVKVRGGMKDEEKQNSADRFQSDPAVRLLVGNIKAANVGLTLTAAHDVAFVQFAWTPADHDQAIDRCYGRVNDAHGATGHYLIMAGTIEEDIFDLVGQKRRVTDAVNAGTDADGQKLSVAAELVARLIKRAGLPGQEETA